jgi:hypothetical protein
MRRPDVDRAPLIAKALVGGLYEEFRLAKIAIPVSLARTAPMISLEREMHTYEVRPRESTADTISWKSSLTRRRSRKLKGPRFPLSSRQLRHCDSQNLARREAKSHMRDMRGLPNHSRSFSTV